MNKCLLAAGWQQNKNANNLGKCGSVIVMTEYVPPWSGFPSEFSRIDRGEEAVWATATVASSGGKDRIVTASVVLWAIGI